MTPRQQPPTTKSSGDTSLPGQSDIFDELAAIVAHEGRRRGEALRDEGAALADQVGTDEWERSCVDAVIEHFRQRSLRTGQPFDANLVRPLVPELRSPRSIGARFLAAARAGRIRKVGYVTSTDPGSHAASMSSWMGVPDGQG